MSSIFKKYFKKVGLGTAGALILSVGFSGVGFAAEGENTYAPAEDWACYQQFMDLGASDQAAAKKLLENPSFENIINNSGKYSAFYNCLKAELEKGNESKLKNKVWVNKDKTYAEVAEGANQSKSVDSHEKSDIEVEKSDLKDDKFHVGLEAEFVVDKTMMTSVRALNEEGWLRHYGMGNPSEMYLKFVIDKRTRVDGPVRLTFDSNLFSRVYGASKLDNDVEGSFSDPNGGDTFVFTPGPDKRFPSFELRVILDYETQSSKSSDSYTLKAEGKPFYLPKSEVIKNAFTENNWFTYQGSIRGQVVASEDNLTDENFEKLGYGGFLLGIAKNIAKEELKNFTYDIGEMNSNVINIRYNLAFKSGSIEVEQNKKLTNEDAKNTVSNSGDFPADLEYTFVNENGDPLVPDTSKTGEFPAWVKVSYPDTDKSYLVKVMVKVKVSENVKPNTETEVVSENVKPNTETEAVSDLKTENNKKMDSMLAKTGMEPTVLYLVGFSVLLLIAGFVFSLKRNRA